MKELNKRYTVYLLDKANTIYLTNHLTKVINNKEVSKFPKEAKIIDNQIKENL